MSPSITKRDYDGNAYLLRRTGELEDRTAADAEGLRRIPARTDFARDLALCDQIRRASISVTSNIAEGLERGGTREFIDFLSIARGSAGEVRAQLYVALDQQYIDQTTFDVLAQKTAEITRTISGLMNYLQRSSHRGLKYKT